MRPKRRVRFWTLTLFLINLSVSSLFGQNETSTYRINDGGMRRSFELAKDEVAVGEGEHLRFERISPRDTVEQVRSFALSESRTRKEPVNLVLYQAGIEKNRYSRRVVSGKILVRLEKDADAEALARSIGAETSGELSYSPGRYIFEVGDPADSLEIAEDLRAFPGVVSANTMLGRESYKRYVPNDTYFGDQWHHANSGQSGGNAGYDINITNVWQTYRGSNVVIGIIDDGLQLDHPDLQENVNTDMDWDWNGDDNDPSPTSSNPHGTACAGMAAARGKNDKGVVGSAPEATLVGLRLIAGAYFPSERAQAMLTNNAAIHIKSNSWGPADNGQTIEGPDDLTSGALKTGVTTGRGGKGTIYVWAGGNAQRLNGATGEFIRDNANYDGYVNSIYTVGIGSFTDDGHQSKFSEPGACLHCVTPSGGGYGGVYTTDLKGSDGYNSSSSAEGGDYTAGFSGTSASAPLAAGAIAVIIEANSNLGWRDVQEVLIRSSDLIQPRDPDWAWNAAGFHFNHRFGAGALNVENAVNLAQSWTNLGAMVMISNSVNIVTNIPDNDPDGIVVEVDLAHTNLRVEHATVTLSVFHPFIGNIVTELESPGGTVSLLSDVHTDDVNNFDQWTFSSVRNWGENSQGKWRVRVADAVDGAVGVLSNVQVTVYGTSRETMENVPPVIDRIGDRQLPAGTNTRFKVYAQDAIDNDEVTLTAAGVPMWASFSNATAVTEVMSEFRARPTSTGTFEVTFYAQDDDGMSSRTITLNSRTPLVPVLTADFSSGMPTGWSVSNRKAGAEWVFNDPGSRGNRTPGQGKFAIVDSYLAGEVWVDTSLRTPVLDLRQYDEVMLEFSSDYDVYSGFEQADVDVSFDGGDNWATVWSHDVNRCAVSELVNISSLAAGEAEVMIRFRYWDAYWDNWWQIDDVVVRAREKVDTDEDQLPNWWERLYAGSITGMVATADSDKDGHDNLQEKKADTNPTNDLSKLVITAMERKSGDEIGLTWTSSDGRKYSVSKAHGSPTNDFTIEASNIGATPPFNSVNITNVEDGVYYLRVDLQ